MEFITPYVIPLMKIIWIDLLLSGDNAVVIALACRSLPVGQRRLGMFLGAGTAIVLRIIFAIFITYLMDLPFLKIVGGLLLLWIGVKLAVGEEEGGHEVSSSDNLWRAVRTIAIADAVMSLDNVLAIAAASGGNIWLFVFGLLLSIPLIVYGSTTLGSLMDRFPIIIWAGAALLGWVAAEMIIGDAFMLEKLRHFDPSWVVEKEMPDGHGAMSIVKKPIYFIRYSVEFLGAVFVVALGAFIKYRKPHNA